MLKGLNFAGCHLDDASMELLAPGLAYVMRLDYLDLSGKATELPC